MTTCCAIVVALIAVFAVSVARRSSAASPPAELISVPPPATSLVPPSAAPLSSLPPPPDSYRNVTPSISGDGGVVAYSQEPVGGGTSYAGLNRGMARDRVAQVSTGAPLLANSTGEQHGTAISRDGCFLAIYTETEFNDPRTPMIEGWNRCVPNAAPTEIPIDFAELARAAAAAGLSVNPLAFSIDFVYGLTISSHGRFVALSAQINNNSIDGSLWIDRDRDGNGVFDEPDSGGVVKTATRAIVHATAPSLGDETLTPLVAVTSSTNPSDPCSCATIVQLWDPTIANTTSVRTVSIVAGTSNTPSDLASTQPSMSPDGRFVAFTSNATNIVSPPIQPTNPPATPPTQIYVRDMTSTVVVPVTRVAGAFGNGNSSTPTISADGTQVAFGTESNNLLAGYDAAVFSSGVQRVDVLVARSASGFFASVAFDRVNVKADNTPLDISDNDGSNGEPVMSANGRYVAWSTTFGAGLGAPASSSLTDVFAVARPAVLTGSSVDFGGVLVGQTTGAQPVTITNSGLSSVLPATITSSSGEFTITGGTCAVNVFLPPGGSCTVTVAFTPTGEGARSTQVVLAESGFGAVSATSIVTGIGTVPATTVAPTTTAPRTTAPRTTAPRTTAPRTTAPRTTAPPTIATVQALAISPNPATFATTVIGLTSAAVDFSVTSSGTAVVPVTSVVIGGVAPTDYAVTSDTCSGASLDPAATCQVSVVFKPIAGGQRPATLTVASATTSAAADLAGVGAFRPSIRLAPDVVPVGRVAIAIGSGFAPSAVVQLQWSTGSRAFSATTDATGSFSLQIPIGPDEATGPRTLTALEQPGVFPSVSAPALIIDGTMQPPGGLNPAFETMTVLVIRG